jgi:hypothetical protein
MGGMFREFVVVLPEMIVLRVGGRKRDFKGETGGQNVYLTTAFAASVANPLPANSLRMATSNNRVFK